jgi:hypothetical protein
MGEGPGVDDNTVHLTIGVNGIDFIDDETFVVGLVKLDGDAEGFRFFGETVLEIGKGFVPVDFGLADAEAVEVGAVDDSNAFHLIYSL